MCLVTLEYSPQLTRCTAPGYLGVLAEQDALLHGLEDHEGDKEEHVGAHQGPEPRRQRLSDGRPRRPLAPRQRRDQNHRQDQSQNLWNGHGYIILIRLPLVERPEYLEFMISMHILPDTPGIPRTATG